MMKWLLGMLVALVGLAHAIASWLYFARRPKERWWLWSVAWVAATVACIAAAHTAPVQGYGLFVGLVAVWTFWWVTIQASATLEWVPENRYQATGEIAGDTLVMRNVRNFDWKDKRTFAERWEDRTYDLAKLEALDLFVCSWGSAKIAHVMVSYVFADQPPLCFSVETRREISERWTPQSGFMKSYELLVIAGDERDLVRGRVNVRGEDVRLYRLYATSEMRRKILEKTIAQINRLAERPRFYNTVFHNCSIEIARVVWEAGQRFPLDWRILVTGYVAEYLYDIELLDRSLSLAELKANADIRAKSKAADGDAEYSRRIREGLADPNPRVVAEPSAVTPPLQPAS